MNILPKTLVIGGANLDITASCFARLIPGDSNPGLVKNSAGGVGRNIAENLQRLGFHTTLLSILGNDIGKSLILDSCEKIGISIAAMFENASMSTGSYVAINNQLGALVAAIADMSIIDTLTPELLEKRKAFFDATDEIIIEANLPEESIHWICSNYSNKPIHADAVSATKAHRLSNLLNKINILKVNREEASAILGIHGNDQLLGQSLFEQGVGQVLLSQGAEGATLFNAAGQTKRPAIKGDNANDTGAGDSLFSGYIAARHFLNSTQDQLEFATACATYTLNSTASVNPELSVINIKKLFLNHLSIDAWMLR